MQTRINKHYCPYNCFVVEKKDVWCEHAGNCKKKFPFIYIIIPYILIKINIKKKINKHLNQLNCEGVAYDENASSLPENYKEL
jgi:hypothetical protein